LFLPPWGFEPLTFRVGGCIPLKYFQMQLPRLLISLEVDGSREVNETHETIPDSCARAHFAGCTFVRRIILALDTVYPGNNQVKFEAVCNQICTSSNICCSFKSKGKRDENNQNCRVDFNRISMKKST
jgi:hypothetical protein